MIQGIDHLVIVVNDLDQAAKDYAALGFTVVPGGRHPVGSHNALISFRDGSYLELIAFYRDAVDHRWWEPLKKGERLVDFCFQTDDLGSDTKKLRDAGVDINDPVPWSRKRPDGYELKWLLSLATGAHRGVAPFLIEDVTPRRERIPQEFHHSNGVIGIDTVTAAVSELGEIQKWYGTLLGEKGVAVEVAELNAKGLSYAVGPHKMEFLVPCMPSSPLKVWLEHFGSSPYSAVLNGANLKHKVFDPRLTHDTHLCFK